MKPTDEIVDRIRKCLALANGRNATPGEMEAAMGKAKEIAMRYNIEIASINMNEGKSAGSSLTIDKGAVKIRSKRPQQYHRWIYSTLMEVFSIRVITHGSSAYFIGEASDVAISQELFPWLEDVFWSTFYKAAKAGILEQYNSAHRNGCYQGLYIGIIRVNKREEEKLNEKDKQCWGLIVRDKSALIDQRVEEDYPDLEKAKSRGLKTDWNAYKHGVAKGQQVNLRQTGGTAPLKGLTN